MVETTLTAEDPAAQSKISGAPAAWDAFIRAHPAGHLLQTAGWGELKSRFGWSCRRVTVPQCGETLAAAQLLLRSVAGLKIAYIPRGPVVDWADTQLTQEILVAARREALNAGAVVLKIEPNLPETADNRALLYAHGFRPSVQTIQPPSTILVDIGAGQTEDEILARMKSKWRYNIRLAQRKGVTVRAMARADLHVLDELMQATGERDGFTVHNSAYYAAAYELFVPDQARFFLAEYEGAPLAAIAVFLVGDTAWYLWGASGDGERNRMPNHALQWAAIRWARDQGARCYDLWGIPDELGQVALAMQTNDTAVYADQVPIDLQRLPAGDLWGVFRFKQGFGGRVIRAVGAWDQPVDRLGFQVYHAAVHVRDLRVSGLLKSSRMPKLVSQRVALAAGYKPSLPYDVRCVENAPEWRATLAQLPDPHVLQSWEWGDVKARAGWSAHRFVVVGSRGRAVAAFQLLTRRPQTNLPLQMAYAPKGPVVDRSDPQTVDRVLKSMEETSRALGCFFVKIDPNVCASGRTGRRLQHALFRRGWRYSDEQIQFKHTAWSDLTPDVDTLLQNMKSKWRYNIRLAERRGIEIRLGGTGDLASFFTFYMETAARDGFIIRPESYYRDVWSTFLAAETDAANPAGGALLLAEHPNETQPVAGLFLMRYGDCVWYFYGASSQRRRRDMPNYLLQWEAMRWSQRQGALRYDWWGAPTDPEDEDDSLQGVWRFKQGFGVELQDHIGAWDFATSPALYAGFSRALPRVRSILRHVTAPPR